MRAEIIQNVAEACGSYEFECRDDAFYTLEPESIEAMVTEAVEGHTARKPRKSAMRMRKAARGVRKGRMA